MRTDVHISLPSQEHWADTKRVGNNAKENKLDRTRLKETAEEFESLLLEHLLKDMRGSIPKSTLFGNDPGRKIFDEMLDGEFARVMSKRGGIGIAEFMVRGMSDDTKVKPAVSNPASSLPIGRR